MSDTTTSTADTSAIETLKNAVGKVRDELGKVIIGQDDVIEQALIAIFTRSHALLVGVPGLAKTLLVSSLAETLHLSFKRIQFTPDLMPSDITGTEVIYSDPATGEKEFKFLKGPIFANIILADEINRTPPKTQAAMLESMQERKVSIGGDDHKLPDAIRIGSEDGMQDFTMSLKQLIDDELIVELKTVDQLLPIHHAQLLTYLKLSNRTLGLLINFNSPLIKNGIKRVVLNHPNA